MKILYLAFACDPCAGSEAQCGWSWPMAMRQYAEVSVVTRLENKASIERYIKENDINDIKVYYHDIPPCLNIYGRTGKFYHVYYLMWQKTLGRTIRQLHDANHYDYIHHVTLGDFRAICDFGNISAKFIFGPIGGAQLTPDVFLPYTVKDMKNEKRREFINKAVTHLPSYKKKLNRAAWIFAANKETQSYIQPLLVHPEKCNLLTENGVLRNKISNYEKNENEQVKIIWSGRMVNRKGLSFLLDVLPLVKAKVPYEVILIGDGSERSNLQQKITDMQLESKVKLVGRVSYEEMQRYYKVGDIFVFPSLRETTGTVLFEAMSNAIPVITFNQNGADLLIDEECGIKINIEQTLNEIKNDFAEAISRLVDNSAERRRLGENALHKIQNEYVWEIKCKRFRDHYLK